NVGFMALDRLGQKWGAAWALEKKFAAKVARVERTGKKLLLCRPETFMNGSGEAVAPVASFYRIEPQRTLVIVDDADLPFGEIRMRASGSSGGHHGLESIAQHLGTTDFPRLRIGIGRDNPGVREITGYVLSQFAAGEQEMLAKVLGRACEQTECWLDSGILKAMSLYNGAIKTENKGN
ncbi:MAG TPA: aminoacyl-tRNA hydrolase, partial [Verrucomicrobiae bacterium]